MNGFSTPRWRNASFPGRFAALLLAAFGLAACFTAPAFGQSFARPDGSIPVPVDWSSKHVLFTAGYTPEQAAKMRNEPRVYAEWVRYGNAPPDVGLRLGPPPRHKRPERPKGEIGRDWAVSLGAGGVAQGMSPAKYTFNVNAAPSCASDFAVFPINALTGNTRANVVGTFTNTPAAGGTTSITITPTGGAGVTLTLTASLVSNAGLNFQVSATLGTNATNLAAAINRNLSNTALDQIVAVASAAAATVTVYALTPGTGVTLTDANTLTHFSWGAVTAGTNGAQANIVAFNQLYSGSGTPLCTGLTDPEFIFSYASGVGPVATSPNISLSGTKISYVENDPNIGAIFHVLTLGTHGTEYGTCTNNGTAMPTCATSPVIPGSTAGSRATDFMLPLGLVAANAATAVAGAADSFSSPFTDYANDTTFVGDNNGHLYSINTTFGGTPTYAGGNFPVQVSAAPGSIAITQIRATAASPSVVTVTTAANTLSLGELVTISGVAVNTGNGCTAADVAIINGVQTVATTGAAFTFNVVLPSVPITGTGCNVATATITPGSNYLSSPVVDVAGTGNIFVGDSSANLYELTQAGGTAAASLALGLATNGGIRDGPIIDSTNAVGYAVTACSNNTVGEADAENAALTQFKFTSTTLTSVAVAGLDTGLMYACTDPFLPMYDPTPDYRYYALGISSATAANNGEIIAAATGSGGQQVKTFQFISSVLQTTPEDGDKPQIGTGASVVSPLTEFFNSQAFSVSGVTATAGTPGVVTVTANNTLVAGDTVTLSGVTLNMGTGCTAGDITAISGVQTVASATTTNFTFDATIPSTTTGCTLTNATAGADYMFMGVVQEVTALYSYLLPAGALTLTSLATNTADVSGGTSAIIVDNNSTSGQASSIYYGTLTPTTGICGATSAYCAVKLTQAALQ